MNHSLLHWLRTRIAFAIAPWLRTAFDKGFAAAKHDARAYFYSLAEASEDLGNAESSGALFAEGDELYLFLSHCSYHLRKAEAE